MPGGVRISFTVKADSFTLALARYLAVVENGKSKQELIAGQLKFLIRGIMDLTPPETLAQGRAAAKSDIRRAMSPWGGEKGEFASIRNEPLRERLQSYQRLGQYDKLWEVWSKIGQASSLQMKDFDPALHHSAQNDRGRVPTDQGIIIPQLRAWKAYVTQVQGKVGRARGGWAASALALGLTVPGWVSRHISGGSFSVQSDARVTTFTMINRAVFIPRYRQNIDLALEGREKALATDVRRFLAGAKTYARLGP